MTCFCTYIYLFTDSFNCEVFHFSGFNEYEKENMCYILFHFAKINIDYSCKSCKPL